MSRKLGELYRASAETALQQKKPKRERIAAAGAGSTEEIVVVIQGFGTEPRGVANSSFLVRVVDDDLNPVGDQFEVYARIQGDGLVFDLTLCFPPYAVGEHIGIEQAEFPIGGVMITGWFAVGTFSVSGCTG